MSRNNPGSGKLGAVISFAAAVCGLVRSALAPGHRRTKRKFRYTEEHLSFIRRAYRKMTIEDVTVSFNAEFGTNVTVHGIRSACKNHGIRCGRKGSDRLINHVRLFTPEHLRFLKKTYPGRDIGGLTVLFNARFGLRMTEGQVSCAVKNHHITCGRTGRFPKGIVPWNKGVKGYMGPNRTSFKKGNAPPNRKPLGSERITRDGFIEVKIAERNPYTGFPTRYRLKHVHVWETLHGPVPEGHVVAFRNGNSLDCEPENLMCVKRAELLLMNLHGYKQAHEEIKPSLLALARLEAKAGIRTRPGKRHRKEVARAEQNR